MNKKRIFENKNFLIDYGGDVYYKEPYLFLKIKRGEKFKHLKFMNTYRIENYNKNLEKYRDYLEDILGENLERIETAEKEEIRNIERIDFEKFRKLKAKDILPEEYKNFDIETYVLEKCKSEKERDRAKMELQKFKENDLLILLRAAKWIVDIAKKENLVYGVGRGSSVASFVLYLLEVHRINPLEYDIDFSEFLP